MEVELWVWGEKGSGSGQPPNSVLSLPRHGWCGYASLSLPLHPGQPPWVLADKKIRIGVSIFLIPSKVGPGGVTKKLYL